MNQKLFLVLVSLGSAVAACEPANPEIVTPEFSGDASDRTDSGASTSSSDEARSPAKAGPGAYRGGSFVTPSIPASKGESCVRIEASEYDTSCTSDADCMSISSGMVCSSGCVGACPNAAINVKAKAHYEAALKRAPTLADKACECGAKAAAVACITGVCTFCPNGCENKTRWLTF